MSTDTMILGPKFLKAVLPSIQEVQRLVQERTNATFSEKEILLIQLLLAEPEDVARSIVYRLTGDPACLSEPGDDEIESHSALPRLPNPARSLAEAVTSQPAAGTPR